MGGNDYEITLTLYRDYGNQVPASAFDNPAIIGVYDENGQYIDSLKIFGPVITNINGIVNNPCLLSPPSLRYGEGIYKDTLTVPSADTGYYFVYQRCCRNEVVGNVQLPAGATYSAFAPAISQSPNSNPVYDAFPGLFLCVNEPFSFMHSATDVDGDSIVYELCAPLDGGDPVNTSPNPPLGPPWTPLVWNTGFGTTDPLGSSSINLNPITGELSGTPPQQGEFVIAVCAREYRNGVLLSTTTRDFTFFVARCNVPEPIVPLAGLDTATGIGIYDFNCNSLSVSFANNSQRADEYFWDFGDNTTLADTSSLEYPSYTYPDTGRYLVTLTAIRNQGCVETLQFYVDVDTACSFCDLVISQFNYVDTNELEVNFINSSTNALSSHWDFGDGNISRSTNPTYTYNAPGTYQVCLISVGACGIDTVCDFLTISCAPPVADFSYIINPNNGAQTCLFQFINESTGIIDSVLWIIDGEEYRDSNPVYIYPEFMAGDNVSLTLYSPCGNTTITQQVMCWPFNIDDQHTGTFTIHPNPSKGSFVLSHEGISNQAELRIQNLQGQVVHIQWLKAGGGNEVSIKFPEAVAAGTYIVSIHEEGKTVQSRLLVVE